METHEVCVIPEEVELLFRDDARILHLVEVVDTTSKLVMMLGQHDRLQAMQLVSWYHDVGYVVDGGGKEGHGRRAYSWLFSREGWTPEMLDAVAFHMPDERSSKEEEVLKRNFFWRLLVVADEGAPEFVFRTRKAAKWLLQREPDATDDELYAHCRKRLITKANDILKGEKTPFSLAEYELAYGSQIDEFFRRVRRMTKEEVVGIAR